MRSLFSLSCKHALIVGDGKIAHAIADLFKDADARVSHHNQADLSEDGVNALYSMTEEVDILVNAAVITGPWTIDTLLMDEWDRVHAVNVRGAYLLMRGAVHNMRKHRHGGRLINISTVGSQHPVLHGNFAYGSSRAGTNALTRQFALDFASEGITSNAILVGAVASDPFPEDCPMPLKGPGMNAERHPMGHGTPQDIAPVALFLASDAARYVNGQAIAVDGGFQIA